MAGDAFDTAFADYVTSAALAEAGVDVEALKAFILGVALPRARIAGDLARLRDELATIEHERWSHWQRYMHGKCRAEATEPGALVIPADLVSKWERQAATAFPDLSNEERESDREQVDRYLPLLVARLTA